jgi:hypothetical protein
VRKRVGALPRLWREPGDIAFDRSRRCVWIVVDEIDPHSLDAPNHVEDEWVHKYAYKSPVSSNSDQHVFLAAAHAAVGTLVSVCFDRHNVFSCPPIPRCRRH